MKLVDSHGRTVDYVRLALTDRCNLRCSYCMPECGIDFVARNELLSYEEMLRVLRLLSETGVNKLRITGGEPFVRKGVMTFFEKINHNKWFEAINITTNATLTQPYIHRFKNAGIKTVNISLDTLNRDKFLFITKRDGLQKVLDTLSLLQEIQIAIKINMVVMAGVNEDDIIPMALMARDKNIEVRFLEEMPFNGSGEVKQNCFNHLDILQILKNKLGHLEPIKAKFGQTSTNYSIDSFKGKVGIIASYSRTFCGTCNRLRITPTGLIKTCLYDEGGLDLRPLLRGDASDSTIINEIQKAVAGKAKDGFEAEKRWSNMAKHESMAAIGG